MLGETVRKAELEKALLSRAQWHPFPTDEEREAWEALPDAINSDTDGLVAQLELARRGLEGGIEPTEAAPQVQHIAKALAELQGLGGAKGRCHCNVCGSPATG